MLFGTVQHQLGFICSSRRGINTSFMLE